ncbi:hypothetical protein AGABI1DRAFT_134168 [Agaricus bisporus var. burnettii JB137-S8]|uniref:Uncharacterized protein n=1 Tax=Agaricus bisporus var. burnettii (strain JB137-S8 / ATCC MYA-4627 / FGSC 10392) TaxID=597362 RepID=K5WER3_AGABU|nr:uncharacterized protein AGABI1DRAFT_134168 [Agaricus bisporus var. burnettii JB137-S8]EKM73741.1 hypothetical protein AGABI1DRAFT_134168 [Agaricus bisporus var. burnettii JB137-S8]
MAQATDLPPELYNLILSFLPPNHAEQANGLEPIRSPVPNMRKDDVSDVGRGGGKSLGNTEMVSVGG